MDTSNLIYSEDNIGIGKGLKVLAMHGRCEVYAGRVVLLGTSSEVIFDSPASEVSVRRQKFPAAGTYLVVGGDKFFVRSALSMTAHPGSAMAGLMARRKKASVLEVAIDQVAGRLE